MYKSVGLLKLNRLDRLFWCTEAPKLNPLDTESGPRLPIKGIRNHLVGGGAGIKIESP